MQWSWVNTEYNIHRVQYTPSTAYTEYSIQQVQHTPSTVYTKYSIHQVQPSMSTAHTEYCKHRVRHHPKINCLLLPASLSAFSGPCCTQFSTFSQLPVDQSMQSQLPSHMSPDLPPPVPLPPDSLPPNVLPNMLNYSFQVHLWVHSISASKYIFQYTQSPPPSEHPNSLGYGLQVCTSMALERISKITQSQSRSAFLSSLDHGLQVYLQIRAIPALKCISNLAWSWPTRIASMRDGWCTEIQG